MSAPADEFQLQTIPFTTPNSHFLGAICKLQTQWGNLAFFSSSFWFQWGTSIPFMGKLWGNWMGVVIFVLQLQQASVVR